MNVRKRPENDSPNLKRLQFLYGYEEGVLKRNRGVWRLECFLVFFFLQKLVQTMLGFASTALKICVLDSCVCTLGIKIKRDFFLSV